MLFLFFVNGELISDWGNHANHYELHFLVNKSVILLL